MFGRYIKLCEKWKQPTLQWRICWASVLIATDNRCLFILEDILDIRRKKHQKIDVFPFVLLPSGGVHRLAIHLLQSPACYYHTRSVQRNLHGVLLIFLIDLSYFYYYSWSMIILLPILVLFLWYCSYFYSYSWLYSFSFPSFYSYS